MIRLEKLLAAVLVMLAAGSTAQAERQIRTFPVLAGAGARSRPQPVSPHNWSARLWLRQRWAARAEVRPSGLLMAILGISFWSGLRFAGCG
jgi:hypothetical protein